MHLKRFFVLVFIFGLFYAPDIYAAHLTLEWKCDKTGTSSASIDGFTWEAIKTTTDCDAEISRDFFNQLPPEYCMCEGTYKIRATSDCPKVGENSPADEQVAYKVNYDNPDTANPQYLLHDDCNPPSSCYYCRGVCVRKPGVLPGTTVAAYVYWDPAFSNGECCGDDYDDGNTNDYDATGLDDPDNSPGFCRGDGNTGGCPLGNKYDTPTHRDWIGSQGCCGDDYAGFGTDNDLGTHGGLLCFHETTLDTKWPPGGGDFYYEPVQEDWHWLSPSEGSIKGGVVYVVDIAGSSLDQSTEHVYYSDGAWKICNTDLTFKIDDHDYKCYQAEGKRRIAECCNTDSTSDLGQRGQYKCWSIISLAGAPKNFAKDKESKIEVGTRHKLGEALVVGGEPYFCTSQAGSTAWLGQGSINPDNLDETSCDAISDYCEWTGSKCCCTFMDDTYYSDDGGDACWNGDVLSDNQRNDDNTIVSFDGMLHHCGTSGYTDEVNDTPYCTVVGSFFCDIVNDEWKSGTTTSQLSSSPDDSETACCKPGKCWPGEDNVDPLQPDGCAYNQLGSPGEPPPDSNPPDYSDGYSSGKRCINGVWEPAVIKITPYGQPGFCQFGGQCLFGQASPLECKSDGFYDRDDYCDGGEWTTRTKILAEDLMSITGPPYTLTCGNVHEVLNYITYAMPIAGGSIANALDCSLCLQPELCFNQPDTCTRVNNFCVLEYSGGVIIGTSINMPIDDLSSVVTAFGYEPDSCDNALGSTTYINCAKGEFKLWFNDATGILLYKRQAGSLGAGAAVLDWLRDALQGITDWALSWTAWEDILKHGSYYVYVKLPERFDKLYVRAGPKKIFAVMEAVYFKEQAGVSPRRPYFAIRYEGFDQDICAMVDEYDDRFVQDPFLDSDYFVCREVDEASGIYEVFGGSYSESVHPEAVGTRLEEWLSIDVWHDLTMKIT